MKNSDGSPGGEFSGESSCAGRDCAADQMPAYYRQRSAPTSCCAPPTAADCCSRFVGLRRLRPKQLGELVDGNASLSNEGAQRALRDLAMIRNGEPPVRRLRMSQDDVTTPLAIDLVPELSKDCDCSPTGDARDRAHTATSTTSSSIAGGIASSRSLRLSR